MSPLLGGELVIAFLLLRIALWIWRSWPSARRVLVQGEEPPPDGGVPVASPRPRPALRLAPPAAEHRLPLAA
jgi:hypothetical protein